MTADIAIEVAVGASPLLPRRFRSILLPLALLLHLMVAVVLGLWSFSIVMWGCLIFLLVPMGTQFRRTVRSRSGTPPRAGTQERDHDDGEVEHPRWPDG
ncbi:hypothetical protein [Mycobacterium sp. NPDC006124]|uniref:hypothetical protein n=1 Tax=Mycobacterium sp. NPDC006124 TaxID=3156729 RepID=UPI0033BDE712